MIDRFIHRFGSKKSEPSTRDAPSPKIVIGVGELIEQRYRLDAEVGRGGMGIVYRAHDISHNRDVAFKVINVSEAGASARQQFLREAQITAQLKHPHIVAVYETGMVNTGTGEPVPFLAMEYVNGQSLDNLRGLTFAQIIDLVVQICDALAYAHDQGLVHRDLKPSNVLVEKHGFGYTAKLMDFGLARHRDANAPLEAGVSGTVYYLAPEVIEGKPAEVTADLYAIGVMLYELVTGRVPFSDFDAAAILTQHVKESVIPPSHTRNDIPPSLEAIILRLLAKDPNDRFASAREVKAALEQISASAPSNAVQSNLPQLGTSLVGRDKEIAELINALESNCLVTLVGAGGIGKTQLALATVSQLSDQFPDGVWFVELATENDPAQVPSIVAAVLGVHPELHRSLTVSLLACLREKNLLLILDHCDHLIGACRQFAETMLQMCPQVRLIATSRCPLVLRDEYVYEVPALPPSDVVST